MGLNHGLLVKMVLDWWSRQKRDIFCQLYKKTVRSKEIRHEVDVQPVSKVKS